MLCLFLIKRGEGDVAATDLAVGVLPGARTTVGAIVNILPDVGYGAGRGGGTVCDRGGSDTDREYGREYGRDLPPEQQVQEIEPHVRCLAGLKVPSTGIVNYREVSAKYVELIRSQGETLQTGTRVDRLRHVNGTHVIETSHGEFEARFTINCAGLFSDRVAHSGGLQRFGG